MSPVRFDEATAQALAFLSAYAVSAKFTKLVAIRDLAGRYRFAIDGDTGALESALASIEPKMGAWLAESRSHKKHAYGRVLARSQLFDAEQVFESPDLVPIAPKVFLLDRRVVAADWQRGQIASTPSTPPRAVFFALKGGSGRSTALVYWVRHLAHDLGKRVLVVDLDLEAPGVSAALLPIGKRPRFGLVDWYVEDAVGQADADLLDQMTMQSPIASGAAGCVFVAPVAGDSSDYLAKLARVYAAPPGSGDLGSFGNRTARLIEALEQHIQPDVTVIDSRAGLHDVAAVSVVRLGATCFLFASPTSECWLGYRYMFEAWGKRPEVVESFRERLQTVAALVPEEGADAYVRRVREQAHDLFSEWIYDDESVENPFNFNLDNEDGPHFPIEVLWNRRFFAHDPLSVAADRVIEASIEVNFGAFLRRADALVLP